MGVKNQQGRGSKDSNHDDVVGWYGELFCSVLELAGVGFGCPDILVGCSGRSELVEIKSDEGDLNAGQRTFIRDWRGGKVRIVRTRDDVVQHVQEIRRRVVDQSLRVPP